MDTRRARAVESPRDDYPQLGDFVPSVPLQHTGATSINKDMNNPLHSKRTTLILFSVFSVIAQMSTLVNAQLIPWSEMITILPDPSAIERFELKQERHDTDRKITSRSKIAAKRLVAWIEEKKILEDSGTWHRAAAPMLVARLWIHGEKKPKYILVLVEWKDTRGRLHKVTDPEVDLLMNEIAKTSRLNK